MRNTAHKLSLVSTFIVVLFAGSASALSRIECLESIGKNATREQLDACVKNASPTPAPSVPSKANNIVANPEEATCLDLGFKRKTEAYGNCVLELQGRKESASTTSDPDDATCRKYGFKPKSNEYAQCRLQIDQAKQDAQRQQAQFMQQQRQYQAQLDEQQRQRSVAAGMALFQLGNGISSGAYNANNSYGTRPTPPSPPNPSSTYFLPGGRTMNCTTTGTVTNCF
jgi:hypothetical protein